MKNENKQHTERKMAKEQQIQIPTRIAHVVTQRRENTNKMNSYS